MSSSVEHSNDIRKPGPVALIASEQPAHQPHEVVARTWLANLASKPLGQASGSAGRQQGGRWDGLWKPLGSKQNKSGPQVSEH
jgi:hypothetical protein